MKKPIQFTLVTMLYIAIHVSCTNSAGTAQSNDQDKASPSPAVAGNKNSVSFKINGKQVNSSGWNISRSIMTGMLVLNITSNMHEEPQTINININGDKPGTYSFLAQGGYNKRGAAYGSYYPDYQQDMMSPYTFEEGTFVITSIDTTAGMVNAEFSGVLKNSRGETLNISDGKVNQGQLKPGVMRY
jgi:hypothetical protein